MSSLSKTCILFGHTSHCPCDRTIQDILTVFSDSEDNVALCCGAADMLRKTYLFAGNISSDRVYSSSLQPMQL